MDVMQKYEWVLMLVLPENIVENRACIGEDNPMSLQLPSSITGDQGDICEVLVLPQLLQRIYWNWFKVSERNVYIFLIHAFCDIGQTLRELHIVILYYELILMGGGWDIAMNKVFWLQGCVCKIKFIFENPGFAETPLNFKSSSCSFIRGHESC